MITHKALRFKLNLKEKEFHFELGSGVANFNFKLPVDLQGFKLVGLDVGRWTLDVGGCGRRATPARVSVCQSHSDTIHAVVKLLTCYKPMRHAACSMHDSYVQAPGRGQSAACLCTSSAACEA